MEDEMPIALPTATCPGQEMVIDDFKLETSSQVKKLEESTKRTLALKKKELRWKLMQVSQAQNRAKLEEIKTAVEYHKKKLSKAEDLASKLREKYVKVVKSAKLSEIQYKKAQAELTQQERHVADEKMQLTKLAYECINTGKDIYGESYNLPKNNQNGGNSRIINIPERAISKDQQQKDQEQKTSAKGGDKDCNLNTKTSDNRILDQLSPFLRTARLNAINYLSTKTGQQQSSKPKLSAKKSTSQLSNKKIINKKHMEIRRTCLSSIYTTNDSIFKNMASYRLTHKFNESNLSPTDPIYSHNICPFEYVCLPDLLGDCQDKACRYQHKSNYQMTDMEKLTDLLSYKPQIAGFKPDPNLSSEANMRMCQLKLKEFAAKMISRNADKSIEYIAKNLVKKIRAFGGTDSDLILKRRELPKTSHMNCPPPPLECRCEPIYVDNATYSDKHSVLSELEEVKVKLEPMDFI